MQVVVMASDEQWEALIKNRPQVEWLRVGNVQEFISYKGADIYFDFSGNNILSNYSFTEKPVVINAVIETLHELNAQKNILRVNGWPGFLQRPCWEIAGNIDESIKSIFENAGIKLQQVADRPGFISARIIAMIVNEAYLALEDEVSSKNEIDIAMKLGTNYPWGPFEWGAAIGIQNIFLLLKKLHKEDNRYKPASLLQKEAVKKIP